MKVPTGTRIEIANQYVAKVEDLIRREVEPKDFKRIVSNHWRRPGLFLALHHKLWTLHRTVQVALNEPHHLSSFEYMDRVQKAMASQFPDIPYILFQWFDGRCHFEFGRAGPY